MVATIGSDELQARAPARGIGGQWKAFRRPEAKGCAYLLRPHRAAVSWVLVKRAETLVILRPTGPRACPEPSEGKDLANVGDLSAPLRGASG